MNCREGSKCTNGQVRVRVSRSPNNGVCKGHSGMGWNVGKGNPQGRLPPCSGNELATKCENHNNRQKERRPT